MKATDDFGHLVHRTPREHDLPGSAGDAAEAILRAPPAGLAARGRGHSMWGRSQVRDGIVAATERLAEVGEVRDGTITVGAGATWEAVLAATLPLGLAPPILTDYLRLSVGGTLTVGGVGPTTWRDGYRQTTSWSWRSSRAPASGSSAPATGSRACSRRSAPASARWR